MNSYRPKQPIYQARKRVVGVLGHRNMIFTCRANKGKEIFSFGRFQILINVSDTVSVILAKFFVNKRECFIFQPLHKSREAQKERSKEHLDFVAFKEHIRTWRVNIDTVFLQIICQFN